MAANYELSGTLHNADLTMLQHLYEDIFHTTITCATEHTVTFSTLSFLISKTSGITLSGAVTVNGHTSAQATIALSTAGINITGSVGALVIPGGHVTVESASLDLTISREKFIVKLAGCVTVDNMNFEVSLYLNKTSGDHLEYTLFGKFKGDLYLRDIVHSVAGSFLDISLQNVALIVSNMEKPVVEMTENVFAYPVVKGTVILPSAEVSKSDRSRTANICRSQANRCHGSTIETGESAIASAVRALQSRGGIDGRKLRCWTHSPHHKSCKYSPHLFRYDC